MFGHLSSTWNWMAVPVKKFRRRIATSITTLVLLGGLAIALLSLIIMNPSRAYADTNCKPNGVTLFGSSWLSGGGVNICNNGSSSADDYGASCVAVFGAPGGSGCSAGYVYAAEKWQCVELVNRLYLTKGWTKATWWGNGNTLVNNVPSGLSKQNNGSISYVNPGDVITLDDGGFGHAGIINTVDSNGTVHIKNQNTGSTTDSSAYIDSGSLGNKNAHYHMNGWSKYWVQAIIHHPAVSYDLRQFYVSNGSWTSFDVTSATGVHIAGNPAVGSGGEWARDTNGHLRQFYVSNGSWTSFDVSSATGVSISSNPTVGSGGDFAQDTSNHLRQFYVSNGSWTTANISGATGISITGDPGIGNGNEWARDTNNHLRQFYVSNGSWTSADISGATGVSISSNPAAGSGGEFAAS